MYLPIDSTRIWDNPYIGQVRLLNGSYITEGRIEIYCNGRWGTVCDDSFTIVTARTVCIQLGYNSFSSWTSGFKYDNYMNELFAILLTNRPGASSQPIWLNRLICSSVQNCLSYCQRCPSFQDNTCAHTEDVYISCCELNSEINAVFATFLLQHTKKLQFILVRISLPVISLEGVQAVRWI